MASPGREPRLRRLADNLGVEDMLAGLAGLCEGACLAKFLSEFRSSVRGGLRLIQIGNAFPGRYSVDPSPPRIGGEPQRFLGGAELRLTESRIRDCDAPLTGGQRKDVADHRAFNRPHRIDADHPHRNRRIDGHAFLPDIGRRQADLGVGGLQPLVVEQSDLHRGVWADRLLLDEALHTLGDRTRLLAGLQPHRFLAGYGFGTRRDRREAGHGIGNTVKGAGGGASRRNQWHGCHRSHGQEPPLHDPAPGFAGVRSSLRRRQFCGSTGSRW